MNAVRRLDPQRIYNARLKSDLSLDDVAHRLRARGFKTTASAVWRWENGKNVPAGDVLASLADALDIEIDAFFTESGEDPEDGRNLRIRRLRAELVRSGRDDLAADLAALTRQVDDR